MARSQANRAATSRFDSPIVRALRAGLMGAGTWLWVFCTSYMLRREGTLPMPPEGIALALATLLAFVAGLRVGFPDPPKSYLVLAGRVISGVLVAAMLCALIVAQVDRMNDAHARLVVLVWTGALGVAVALGRSRAVRALAWARSSARRQTLAGAAAVAVVLVTIWPQSGRLRCTLGSSRGCREAALTAAEESEDGRALELARRGCELGDARSCAMAGDALWSGYHGEPPHNGPVAAPLYRDACALGDDHGCATLHTIELHARCAAQSASACRELGEAYRPSNAVEAQRYFAAACLLGDEAGCAHR